MICSGFFLFGSRNTALHMAAASGHIQGIHIFCHSFFKDILFTPLLLPHHQQSISFSRDVQIQMPKTL
jgi:hypothetical protein